ncbi:MAG: glycosyltransferase [Terriglobia bacterium]
MTGEVKHICVCICTYKRPYLLTRLLGGLGAQDTHGRFSYSIVVVDNDHLRSAEPVVSAFAVSSPVPIRYWMEPQQNVALARNKAIENANGDFIALIDDDEFPTKRWLLTLFEACNKYYADGALGPVRPYYGEGVPKWIVKGKFYDRPTYPTGLAIDRTKGRTGNVLLKRRVFTPGEQPFRPEFRSGEDQEFFGRKIEEGYVFIWCHEAVAFEVVPPARWKRTFMLKRALLRGSVTPLHPTFGAREVVKSVVAIPVYTLALPFLLALGQHRFMNVLIKLCDHLGRLLACVGIKPINVAYVTE